MTEEERARAAVDSAEAASPDATHHCWAMRLATPRGPVERGHDAGEPAGTAGIPILQAIRGEDLFDLVVVVARYFGGTKLGKGGLARAYREAARGVLRRSPRRRIEPRAILRIAVPIGRDGQVRHLLARHGGLIERASYPGGGRANLIVGVPAAAVAALSEEIEALTRGEAEIGQIG